MHLFLICDTFYPKQNSGAIQLKDLANSLVSLNNSLTIFTIGEQDKIEKFNEFDIVYIKPFFYNSKNYYLRFMSEISYSFYFKKAILNYIKNDKREVGGLIFYSPSIFFGHLIGSLKKKLRVKSFLILRDIFPEWAVDLGIIKNSISIRIFKYFSSYQYRQADYIGVQAQSNIKSAANWIDEQQREKLVKLYNWLTPHKTANPSFMYLDNLKVDYTNKKIFIYAGNVGDAQDLNLFVDAAAKLLDRKDILFIIIGKGKNYKSIFNRVDRDSINNVIMLDEIDNNKLFEFLPLCYAGIISLNKNHKLDNIPGKLLSYLSVGIPTLGAVNQNNELVALNKRFKYGLIYDSGKVDDIVKGAIKLAEDKEFYLKTKKNSFKFFNTFFTTKEAASKILDFLN